MGDISGTLAAATSGLKAQTARLRIAAENVANANSTAETPEADPYRRRIPLFEQELLKAQGAIGVKVVGAQDDPTPFKLTYQPGHPAADANGYVKAPNVDALVEMMDMREASRAYEANMNMVESARAMAARALDILRR